MNDLRLNALALHLGIEVSELNISTYNGQVMEHGTDEYLVVTDEEADDLWEEDLDSYLEECVLSELPEIAARYFDSEAWKRDAKFDGRGHSLSPYDGNEEYLTVYKYENNGGDSIYTTTNLPPQGYSNSQEEEQEEFYIYRLN